MAVHNVKELCESTRDKLKQAIEKMETFLNDHTLRTLNPEQQEDMELFYKEFLSDLRQLIVFSQVSFEKLGIALRRPNFHVDYAEKVLYDVYHNCVNRFFYPQNECYSEDGRYAYTGQDAIRFRKKPNREVRDVIIELSKIFEVLREDLVFYETDYMTEKKMKGEPV